MQKQHLSIITDFNQGNMRLVQDKTIKESINSFFYF